MTILEKLEAMEDFTYVERKIARYILEHKDDVGEMTISGLAAMVSGSCEKTEKSASLPTASEPTRSAIPTICAGWMVMAASAC